MLIPFDIYFYLFRFENSSEPISEIITVTITIFDGIFNDSVMFNFSTLVINDNPPLIYADPAMFDLSEGDNYFIQFS